MVLRKIVGCVMGLCLTLEGAAQKEVVKGWHLLDKETDGYNGISLEKAYDFLKNKKSGTVVVAVLDGGIDTLHEDLKNVLWQNPKEKSGNGKDDDGNGYVDDLYGWNFLGSPDGTNVEKESPEAARLYHQLKPWFDYNKYDTACLQEQEQQKYKLWQQVSKAIEMSREAKLALGLVTTVAKTANLYDSVIRTEWGTEHYSAEDLENFSPATPEAKKAKMSYLRVVNLLQLDRDLTNTEIFGQLNDFIRRQQDLQKAKDSPVINYRTQITGDDENNWQSRHYGNADVMGPSSMHGTHVSGIIGAERNNGIGINGVANNVRIMTVRVVPDGDEHDKDVALGIHYAVDNGAKVINMSFGKEVSPHKQWVDEAIRYAGKHDVLIVHAAGNESENLDVKENYPSPFLNDNSIANNIITVGASGDSSLKCGMVADFTNYGQQTVDVMAPGVKIYSCVPSASGYAYQQGTSMAAPVVSGLAALIRGYYPSLTAVEVKKVIEQSVDTSMANVFFPLPGGGKKELVRFGNLCKTGGIVNAYMAVRLADAMAAAKRKG